MMTMIWAIVFSLRLAGSEVTAGNVLYVFELIYFIQQVYTLCIYNRWDCVITRLFLVTRDKVFSIGGRWAMLR